MQTEEEGGGAGDQREGVPSKASAWGQGTSQGGNCQPFGRMLVPGPSL